tara:strand:- start:6592 stop:6801 length:210 start_codon:yes stop_codon:yes gene_type:complete
MSEGNILSFKILINRRGQVITELSGLPEDKIDTIFKGQDKVLMRKIIQEGRVKLEKVHGYLEGELDALK